VGTTLAISGNMLSYQPHKLLPLFFGEGPTRKQRHNSLVNEGDNIGARDNP
jgi:hypothetical protein